MNTRYNYNELKKEILNLLPADFQSKYMNWLPYLELKPTENNVSRCANTGAYYIDAINTKISKGAKHTLNCLVYAASHEEDKHFLADIIIVAVINDYLDFKERYTANPEWKRNLHYMITEIKNYLLHEKYDRWHNKSTVYLPKKNEDILSEEIYKSPKELAKFIVDHFNIILEDEGKIVIIKDLSPAVLEEIIKADLPFSYRRY